MKPPKTGNEKYRLAGVWATPGARVKTDGRNLPDKQAKKDEAKKNAAKQG
jgi:hypothetical protein